MDIVHPLDPNGPASFACAQAGCPACLEALMARHTGLIHAVLRQQSSGRLTYAELLQAGQLGLWQAVLHFDAGRGVAFSTYAGVVIARRIWQAVRQADAPQGGLRVEAPPDPRMLAEDQLWWTEVRAALAAAIARLPGRQRQVLLALCGWDGRPPRTLAQIGREWGVSRQAVAYWYQKALVSLRLPAVSGGLFQLWGQDSRAAYARCQALRRAWLRQRRGRRGR